MKKIILVSATYVLLTLMASAQGTLYMSNAGQTPAYSNAVASDAWIAQEFITGTNSEGYILNSIQLLMDAAFGSPSGFAVSIYNSSNSGALGSSLGNLTGSLDPSAADLFTYTASGLNLSPSTLYYVVATAATPTAQGAYIWSAGRYPFVDTVSGGWSFGGIHSASTDGSNWNYSRGELFQMAIYAMPVPEPSTYALAGLGLLSLGLLKRKNR